MSAPGFTQAATGFGYRDGVLCAEDVPLPQIAAAYDSPCYVYSRAALEASYAGYVRALAGRNGRWSATPSRPTGHTKEILGAGQHMDVNDIFKDRQSVLLDGAVGTEIERRGYKAHSKLWTAPVIRDNPQLLLEIHQAYISSGAQIITAHTFAQMLILYVTIPSTFLIAVI